MLYLTDMIESINKIETYTKGIDYDSFCFNKRMFDAVVRKLEALRLLGPPERGKFQVDNPANPQNPYYWSCFNAE